MIRFVSRFPVRFAGCVFVALAAAAPLFVVLAAAAPLAAQDDGRARARVLIERADAAASSGRGTEAVKLLEAAEREAPDWPELKVNLAAARSGIGDYKGAASAARAALALDPTLDGARFTLGLALLKDGDAPAAAVTLAPYASSAAPPAVYAALGLAWMQMDRAADAAPVLQRAIDAGIRDRDVLLAAARAWVKIAELDKARGAAELLRAEAPKWVETHLLQGDIADAGQDWPLAAKHYEAARDLEPRSAQARYSLGLVLYKERGYGDAAREFEQALALDPAHVSAHYYLGLLELDRGKPQRALEILERASTLDPRRGDIARDLGRARIDAGEFEPAVDILRRAIELSPEDPSAWFLLGRALQRTGHAVESRAAFAKAVELNQLLRERLQKRISGIKK
jgi:tetratricopeptide (TPR) repeat protein